MLKYYFDLMSQPCRAVYIFLNKTKIPYEKCKVDVAKGAHKTEEYKAIHPFQVVPAIDDGGFKLFESVAILRYLCRAYPSNVADHWYPQDAKQQARVDQYMAWQHANTRFQCAMYFQHKTLIPLMTGTPPKQSSVDRFQSGMEQVLVDFETYWLKDSKFVAGQQVSIADILAVCELLQPVMSGYDVFKDHPVLSNWHEEVKSQLDPELEDANVILRKFASKFAKAKL